MKSQGYRHQDKGLFFMKTLVHENQWDEMRLKLSRLCFSLLEYLTGLTLYSLYLIFSLSLFFRRWSWWGWIRSRLDRRSSHPCVRHYCCPGHCLQRLHEREAVSRFVSLSLFYFFTCLVFYCLHFHDSCPVEPLLFLPLDTCLSYFPVFLFWRYSFLVLSLVVPSDWTTRALSLDCLPIFANPFSFSPPSYSSRITYCSLTDM